MDTLYIIQGNQVSNIITAPCLILLQLRSVRNKLDLLHSTSLIPHHRFEDVYSRREPTRIIGSRRHPIILAMNM